MGESVEEAKLSSFTQKFYDYFPYYLSMGMDYETYWNKNPFLVRCYKKAFNLKQEAKEYELWKQGMYNYEALIDVSPILHAFAKNGTKPRPYSEKPYGIEQYQEKTEENEQKKIENARLRARLHFLNLKNMLSQQFKKGEQ